MAAFMFNRIKKWRKIIQLLVSSVGLFCTGCICFCSGITNESSIVELAATNITKFVLSNSETNYISIQIASNNSDAKKTMPNTYNEYFYWKYIFRHSDFGYLSTVNGGKTHECYFKEIDTSENISFVFCGNNSNPEYEGYYKHEVYDIKLMFKGKNTINHDAINFFAISQTRANQLLTKRGEPTDDSGNYSLQQYEKLLGTNTELEIDNIPYLFTISNVYFESGEFHSNVSTNFGEYVVSYIHFPDSLETEATYIFNTYDYQNIHKIKRLRAIFDSANFSFSLSPFNLKNGDYKLSDVFNYNYIFSNNVGNSFVSISLLIFSFIVLAISLYILWLSESIHNIKNIIVVSCSFLLPYLLLSVINLVSKIPLIYSYFSLIFYLIMFVILITVLVLILFRKRGDLIRKLL